MTSHSHISGTDRIWEWEVKFRGPLLRVKWFIQKIKEGKLQKLISEILWMYAYVRKYWFLILIYILLGASGSVLGLGTSVVSKDLVDAITGVNTKEILSVAFLYVGVGVSQIFINAVKMRLSLRVRLKVTNEIRADIYEQVLRTDWADLSRYRSGDLSAALSVFCRCWSVPASVQRGSWRLSISRENLRKIKRRPRRSSGKAVINVCLSGWRMWTLRMKRIVISIRTPASGQSQGRSWR